MARDGHQPQISAAQADLLRQFEDAISDLDPGDLRNVLQRMLAAGVVADDPFEWPTPPSQRRPRRDDVVTYRVRIDLVGTKPPVWRRLELASDLFLDDLHEIIQVAFGWTDSHLHRFGRGPEHFGPDTEYYLCPFDVEEGETGIPEDDVRLDEVLVEVGDKLFYAYDFGDNWQHTIRLEAVVPRDDSAPQAICTAGRRPGPAEDCGGIHGYEMIAAATDPTHPDHPAAVAEYADYYGIEADPAAYRPIPFAIDEINAWLAVSAQQTDLPEPLDELVQAVRTSSGRQRLHRLIADAALDRPVHVDADTAARMVRPYTWLLDRVGTDGITLTGAGYLPPVHVEAAVAELGLATEWIGKGNREIQTLPVLDLRESAQKAGLLRKHRGKLLLTTRARTMRRDPVALWWQLAEKTPPRSTDPCETQAGLILLLATAAEIPDSLHATVADLLGAIGWVSGDDAPLTGSIASHAAWHTAAVLRRMGVLAQDHFSEPERPTPDGVVFARAALTTWPESPHPWR
jgi:hypothetical protein